MYIGQTKQRPSIRWNQHSGSPKSNMYISKSIKKYGKKNFKFEVIDFAFDKNELNELETYWINILNTMSPNGYNLREGAEEGLTYEVKRKISAGSALIPPEVHKKRATANANSIRSEKDSVGVFNLKGKYQSYYCMDGKTNCCGKYDCIEFAKLSSDLWTILMFNGQRTPNMDVDDVKSVFIYLFNLLKYKQDLVEEFYNGLKIINKSKKRPETDKRNKKKKNPNSNYKGVHSNNGKSTWLARIFLSGKTVHIGVYETEIEAALAYDIAAIKYRNGDCYLNFPEVWEKLYEGGV